MSPEIKRVPMSPAEVPERQVEQIPEEVFVAFNALITRNIRSGRATVLQKDVLEMLENRGMNRREVFHRHWLDVEDSYRAQGWKVEYDRPIAWGGEDFEAYFEFRAPKGGPKPVQEYY